MMKSNSDDHQLMTQFHNQKSFIENILSVKIIIYKIFYFKINGT